MTSLPDDVGHDDDVTLLTNALVHAPGSLSLTLSVTRSATELTVEVTDRSSEPPRPRQAAATDESDHGLDLLSALSHEWGTYPYRHPHPPGKTVWYTLSLTPDRSEH